MGRGRGEGDPEEVYEERAENAAQRGFLNLWHAGLARLAARLRSIRIHPAIVLEEWRILLGRCLPFDVISLYTSYFGSTARELVPYLPLYSWFCLSFGIVFPNQSSGTLVAFELENEIISNRISAMMGSLALYMSILLK